MKTIEIHSKKELEDDEVAYPNKIDGELIKSYIFGNIDFSISEQQWEIIDSSFAECWNGKIGVGGLFYWDEVADYVYKNIQQNLELLSEEKVAIIVDLMLTKIENDGGFLDL